MWPEKIAHLQTALQTALPQSSVELGGWAEVPETETLYINWATLGNRHGGVNRELALHIDHFHTPASYNDLAAMTSTAEKQRTIETTIRAAFQHNTPAAVVLGSWTSDLGAFRPTVGQRLTATLFFSEAIL